MERSIGHMHCRECQKTVLVGLRKQIAANGGVHYLRVCLDNLEHKIDVGGVYVSHASVLRWGFYPDAIPVWSDNRQLECEVAGCEEPGFESHHWAPREVFGLAAEKWPRGLLCKTHHDEWHKRMVGYRVDTTSDLKIAIEEVASAKRATRPAVALNECVILKNSAAGYCRTCGVYMDHDVHSTDAGFWCAEHCPKERHK